MVGSARGILYHMGYIYGDGEGTGKYFVDENFGIRYTRCLCCALGVSMEDG